MNRSTFRYGQKVNRGAKHFSLWINTPPDRRSSLRYGEISLSNRRVRPHGLDPRHVVCLEA
eukprot:14750531-Heterocapsa_arctica.AAC.1